MTNFILLLFTLLLFNTGLRGQIPKSDSDCIASQQMEWPEPLPENRPGCYWWWMGSAVDEKNITWNLETLRRAGMGGVSIVPIYGVRGYEDKFLQYLSPKWIEMMNHAVQEAERLGMWVDMTTGTGWPFGGPMISVDDADAVIGYKEGKLSQHFSGRYVKRAAPGNKGMAINPYSAKAMTTYLNYFDEAFAGKSISMPRAQYHDSFEFLGNWCQELPGEFKKLHGYDLLDHLPELFGEGDLEKVARIKSDYRQTLSELHLAYLETWVEWSEKNGCTTRNQAHGSPSNLLDLYAASGIPETEIFGASQFMIPGIRREQHNVDGKNHPQPLINRMASSAAHVAGRPLIAAEACTWIRNHFQTALSQVKPEIDQLFLNGINHIFFHGSCYSPQDAPWPGWLFYASLQYNPRNAIWRDTPFLNAYITRCQSILQSGKPDNEVALYWPVYDIWHSSTGMQQQLTVHSPQWLNGSTCGKAASWLKANGYGFDFISDQQLVSDKGQPYRSIIVPETDHMPLATLKKLLALVDKGQQVLFLESLPADVPGFHKVSERQAELKMLLQGRETSVVMKDSLRRRLSAVGAEREPMIEAGLDFIRRTHGQGHHYFVANMSDQPVDSWIALSVPLKSAVIMDPYSAATGVASLRNGKEIYLQLLPGETRIIRTFADRYAEGPKWPLLGKAMEDSFVITGQWRVKFIDGGPRIPSPFTASDLKSWVEHGDEDAKSFAGTAQYAIEFVLPESKADNWVIDLGDVRESARVSINGKQVATLWSVPFKAQVGEFLRAGRNLLEVEVTNLSANRLRDLDIRKVDWKIFHDINFVNHNYQTFDASQWELVESGLLGPVRLIPMIEFLP